MKRTSQFGPFQACDRHIVETVTTRKRYRTLTNAKIEGRFFQQGPGRGIKIDRVNSIRVAEPLILLSAIPPQVTSS